MAAGLSDADELVRGAKMRASDRLRWARTVRHREITQGAAVLADPRSYGIVISGENTLGKSAVASALLADVEGSMHAVRLRSTIVGRETPYGALALLLARLPPDAQADPGSTMRGILQILAADAGGKQTVLALETANNLDELSTATLINIMITGTAKLVIVADRTSDLPPDFHWMLTEDRLRDIPLTAISPEATLEAVGELLGGLVPRTVGLQLHALSRGNPQILLLSVSELLETGGLRPANGVWTLAPHADTSGSRQLDDLVRARLEREPAEVQTVIEALACARRMPLEGLTAVFSPAVVADMDESGLITVDEGGRHSVSLTDPFVGDVVRGWLSVPRRRQLRQMLLGDSTPPLEVLSTVELLGFAAWTRECHAILPVRHAIAAASASLRLFDPQFALECLEGVEREPGSWGMVQRLRARASQILQLPRQALAYLDEVTEAELEAESPSDLARYVAARAESMSWIEGSSKSIPAMIDEARAALTVRATARETDGLELRRAAEILDLAEFEHFAFIGEFAEIIDRLEAVVAAPEVANPELRVVFQCILMEARTVMGREQEGLALMHEVASELDTSLGAARARQEFSVRGFSVLLLNGHWRQCLALLRGSPSWPLARTKSMGAAVELGIGIAYVYAGRGHEAVPSLLSAIAMLEQYPVLNTLGSAYAATALAYAQQGEAASARQYLAKLDSWSGVCSYATQASIEFCAEMARHWIGDADAAGRLIESAREDIRKERWTRAGVKLVGASVGAGEDVLELLEDVCTHRQGAFAKLGLLLARGSRTGSLPDLTGAADIAASLELDSLEARCVAVGIDCSRASEDAVAARIMQARLDRLAGRVPVLPVVPSRALPVLTVREREVAILAARGTSNRQIAEDLGLSVRTVEGHLYQVFAKLAVSTRTELSEVL
ncbi:LuxR family transcriptional regulator [Sinomonas mesophila]|uniref:LuxR family transcriptional regulator n=1 Tax=Sinomonas mesophila TaxID=1531955 RepID=UPI0009874432|nr:LuxR family transcriptional regulator [Sinomonas mesophila]